jgi:hypothetical protein
MYSCKIILKGNKETACSEPNISGPGPGTWIQVTHKDMFCHKRGDMNFYTHRVKENYKSVWRIDYEEPMRT